MWITSIFSTLTLQTVLFGILVALVLYKIMQKMKYKEPPGPFALPIIGNYDVMKAKFLHEKFAEYTAKYGAIFQVFLGTEKVVVLNDFKLVREALIDKKADFANVRQTVSTNLMSDNGKDIVFAKYNPTWKIHKKIAGKALRQYMTGSQFEAAVHKAVEKCLDNMAKEKGEFDPTPHIELLVFNIIYTVAFGEGCANYDAECRKVIDFDNFICGLFGEGLLEDAYPFIRYICPTKKYREAAAKMKELKDMLHIKLKQHQDNFDQGNMRGVTDTLILARKEAESEENSELVSKLTDDHLAATLFDIVFGGVDELKLTLLFALRYMAGLPDIQSAVQEEIDRAVGRDRFSGIKDKANLTYTEAALYETMRLGTVNSISNPHSTSCNTQVGGYDVQKNTTVIINQWGVHHDPIFWKDVNKFDPSRYIKNGKLVLKPEGWIPFSLGIRSCLAEGFSKPSFLMIFTSFFQRFRVSLAGEIKSEVEISGYPGLIGPAPYQISVKERI